MEISRVGFTLPFEHFGFAIGIDAPKGAIPCAKTGCGLPNIAEKSGRKPLDLLGAFILYFKASRYGDADFKRRRSRSMEMKKLLVFALAAMVAGGAMAQVVSFVGNSAMYVVEEAAWYNGSASWAAGAFQGHNFGTVYSLTLGGNAETWWDDSASHPGTTTVVLNYQVDATAWDAVSLPWLSYTPNNDKWENMTGEDVIAISGVGAGSHTLAVYFSATDGANTVYDSNGGANYNATFATAIPEPATMGLLGLGALALVLRRKMRK